MAVRRSAPLDAVLRFRGHPFARARLATGAEPGLISPRRAAVYSVAAAADQSAPVALGGDGVAKFVRESAAGVFELQLAIVGEVKYEELHRRRSLSVSCPLKLALSTATAPAAFARIKCA